ncbi:hypothetical protein [Sphingomonas abietis]|uniref:Antifreeze protein n=1 Tax=Sphingomonas abietis TaxID=3012344 RepID=A0ABY7NKT6_9SPHN|nr:hypothetical protein [Sphingomonas abietis]WBO21187.1 hypothetical protein PBT88_13385 [Sphingomonas abietis]
MRRRTKAAAGLLAGAALLAVAIPAAFGQSPQSLLPPGFGSAPKAQPAAPTPPAPPVPSPARSPAPSGDEGDDVQELPTLSLAPPTQDQADAADVQADADKATAAAKAAAALLREQDIPEFARRSTDHIGFLSPTVTGIPQDGFGNTAGRYLKTLMARMDAPIASRWVSMLLRRVLTTDIETPGGVNASDWVAERALLLTRMGEADAARLLVQRVDPDKATPRYYDAVLEAAMATADPGALCPVAEPADGALQSATWPLARAMCAGLQNEGGTASALIDRARSLPNAASGIDLALAERVVGSGTSARRAPDVQWTSVNSMTSWRFGLGSALGMTIPDYLLDQGGLAMQGWRARAPMLPVASRLKAMRVAATLGVMSSADLVDALSQVAESGDPYAMDDTPAGRLRKAYAAQDESDRVAALRALWANPEDERDQYASRILTARAAARINPSSDYAADASALIGAMLSAGCDIQAQRWADVVRGAKGTAGDEAWALMAVGAPRLMVDVDTDRVADFGSGGRGSALLRAQFLYVGLAALGRIPPRDAEALAQKLHVNMGDRNAWTQAIDQAAAKREPATVALLAAVGMQTTDWSQVSPVFLYHIIAALRAVGFEPEARMVAAEALMRT